VTLFSLLNAQFISESLLSHQNQASVEETVAAAFADFQHTHFDS
jgi:hypothetical protein